MKGQHWAYICTKLYICIVSSQETRIFLKSLLSVLTVMYSWSAKITNASSEMSYVKCRFRCTSRLNCILHHFTVTFIIPTNFPGDEAKLTNWGYGLWCAYICTSVTCCEGQFMVSTSVPKDSSTLTCFTKQHKVCVDRHVPHIHTKKQDSELWQQCGELLWLPWLEGKQEKD